MRRKSPQVPSSIGLFHRVRFGRLRSDLAQDLFHLGQLQRPLVQRHEDIDEQLCTQGAVVHLGTQIALGLLDAELSPEVIGQMLKNAKNAEDATNELCTLTLRRMSLLRAKPDNLSIVLIRLKKAKTSAE